MKTPDSEEKKKKNWKKWIWIILLILVLAFVAIISIKIKSPKTIDKAVDLISSVDEFDKATSEPQDSDKPIDTNFIKAVTVKDTVEKVRSSKPLPGIDSNYKTETDKNAGKNTNMIYDGKRINIAIIGLDARMGTVSNHADANEILSIMPDNGKIEITAIPRDTPADAGMSDDNQNKLTIVRANRGRKAYLKAAAKIAKLDEIPYYVEVGFSQVMGILELFGYHDTKSALQVLRSRKALGGDDYQRCYNQAQFIRQLMLNHFGKVKGPFGGLLIRGGLALVETNLNASLINQIVEALDQNGFGNSPDDIIVKVRPPIGINFKVHNFTQQETFDELQHRIERKNRHSGNDDAFNSMVSQKLWNAINSAAKDSSSKRYRNVISKLKNYYNQRAWMQVSDVKDRDNIRSRFRSLMSGAYYKLSQPANAEAVQNTIDAEKELFENAGQY